MTQVVNWNEHFGQMLSGVAEISRLSPDIPKGYRTLGAAAAATNQLAAKVNELIALAVAVTVRCDGCVAVLTEAAIRAGATKEEITEALGTAVAVNAGAALVYSTRVMDAFYSATR